MKHLYFILLAAFFTVNGFAQDFKITHGPYLTDMTSDGVTVVWTTNKPALSWVELAPNEGNSFYATERPKYFDTKNGRKAAYKTIHKVRLKKLQPATDYAYRVYSQEVLDWQGADKLSYGRIVATSVKKATALTFRTYDDKASKSSFVIVNDIHGKADKMKRILDGIDFKQLDFVVMNGDMATHFKTEAQVFKDFIDTAAVVFASKTPVIYARGNHEHRGPVADQLIDYFPTRSGEFYQFYRVGKVGYLVLDAGEDKPDSDIEYGGLAAYDELREEEAKWLEKLVETEEFKSAEARIVFLHIPPMHSDWHGCQHIGKLFVPILNRANIDVMFSGHQHKYRYQPAGSPLNFPLIVNDADSYLKCDVTDKNIEIQIVSSADKSVKKHTFPIK